ncbi:migration and invasion enhancer 1 [Microplitis demolitor]|uniref:migration and invasion enhancer 1 n=1 Tax=Microplitis demolitor TaxID=69319 RepID=UPI0004CD5ADE|nr:migration and invasion enhancer 1 [Microplitis demolitor]
MAQIKIDVEYCGSCGHRKQFLEMSDLIKKDYPDVKISGEPGKQGSFEIKINDELIYSKLQTMAFPEYNEVVDVVKEVTQGQAPRKITKQQPIDCIIM